MNKQDLANLVASFAHRPDLVQQILDDFIPLAESRIGRELRASENEIILEMQPTDSPFDVPDDYGSIRALTFERAQGPFTLTSLDLHSINQWNKTGGSPARYTIAARQIFVRPFIAGDFTLYYFQRPTLPDVASENAVLDAWPNLYLYGTLIALQIWAQDQEQTDLAVTAFTNEVNTINRDADRGRGEKPAMRRA